MVRYAVSMSIRMVCFILAVILQNWMTWVLLAAAVVLPYVAVTTANVGADRYMGRRQSEDMDSPALLTTVHEEGEPEAGQQWWEEDDSTPYESSPNGVSDSEVIPGELAEQDEPLEQGALGDQDASADQDGSTQPLDDQDTHR